MLLGRRDARAMGLKAQYGVKKFRMCFIISGALELDFRSGIDSAEFSDR